MNTNSSQEDMLKTRSVGQETIFINENDHNEHFKSQIQIVNE